MSLAALPVSAQDTPTTVPAPQADSFFDVFTDIDLGLPPPREECMYCDIIRQWIADKQIEVMGLQFNLMNASIQAANLQSRVRDAQREAEKAERALEDFRNPKSWVENADGSNHIDSSDLAAERRMNADLWQQYKNGEITAQELSDAWGGSTSADRDRVKDQIEQELRDRAEKARAEADALQKELDALLKEISEWQIQLAGAEAYIESLQKSLSECERKCSEGTTIDPIVEFPDQLPIFPQDSWWDDLKEFFGGIFGGDEEEDQMPGPGGAMGGGAGDDEGSGSGSGSDGQETPPMTPADSFFDIFVDREPPPPSLECLLCDPILEEIAELEQQLKGMEGELADAQKAKAAADQSVRDAQAKKAAAEKALNDFNNPKSWISNADGSNRIDSSDLAAQRARNQSLWNDYKNGDLSAKELGGAWGQPMTEAEKKEWKDKVRDNLEQAAEDAADAAAKAKEEAGDAAEKEADLVADMQAMKNRIEELMAEYEECLKQCVELETKLSILNIVADLDIQPRTPDEWSFVDWIWDIFVSDEGEEESTDDQEEEQSDASASMSAASESASDRFDSMSSLSDDESKMRGGFEDQGMRAGFSEVGGIETEVTPIDYRTGQEDTHTGKTPGLGKCTIADKRSCVAQCDGECEEKDGCWFCKNEPRKAQSASAATTSTAASKATSAAASSVERETTSCPTGKTPDQSACEEVCGQAGGVCEKDGNGCYGCTVYECPSGTEDSCPSDCANGCDEVGDGGKSCYVCKKSCEEVCADEGYARVGSDWTSYILEYVSPHTCVSGATAQIQIGSIGSCTCSNQPSITINQTVPVCKGTTCGDVLCGQSTTCQQGETTVTVSCKFKGWNAAGENKVQAVIGQ
jgi:hypothetical protein